VSVGSPPLKSVILSFVTSWSLIFKKRPNSNCYSNHHTDKETTPTT